MKIKAQLARAELPIAILFASICLLLFCDCVVILRMTSPDWSVVWTAATAGATVGLGVVAWYQIRALEKQQRGWETLRVCNLFDLDPTLVATRQRLLKFWSALSDDANHIATVENRFDLSTLLNYFDAIAIGIKQKFYKADIVKAHLQLIMKKYRETLLSDETAERSGLGDLRDGYKSFISLVDEW